MSQIDDEKLFSLFDLTQNSEESRQNGCSIVKRFYDEEKKDAFVKKTYKGSLSPLQARESALLLFARMAEVQYQGQTHPLYTRVAAIRRIIGDSLIPEMELIVRWHGLDLQDWDRLALRHHDAGRVVAPLMQNIEFLLALTRSTLRGLFLMHLAGLVHCDIKADNLVLLWLKNSLQRSGQGVYAGSINPDQLKIIDLGLTLKKKNERGDIPDLGGVVPAPYNHAPRLVAAYEQHIQSGSTAIFEALDWRVDMWAVGRMMQDWGENPELLGPKRLSDGFFQLLLDLKSIEEDYKPGINATQSSQAPADLPHPALINRIDALIGPIDHAWPFVVAPAGVRVSPVQAQPSTLNPAMFKSVPAPAPPAPAAQSTPVLLIANRYQPQGDGSEVLDTQTGLIWQRFSVGQSWDAATSKAVGKAGKFTFAEAQKLGGGGWRVPTVRELFSLVYGSKGLGLREIDLQDGGPKLKHRCLGEDFQRPTINLEAFPCTAEYNYWTSSELAGYPDGTWFVSFHSGYVDGNYRRNSNCVRLVWHVAPAEIFHS